MSFLRESGQGHSKNKGRTGWVHAQEYKKPSVSQRRYTYNNTTLRLYDELYFIGVHKKVETCTQISTDNQYDVSQ